MVVIVCDVIVVVKQPLEADEDEAEEFYLCAFALLDEQQFEHYLVSFGIGLVDDQGQVAC